MSRSAPSTDAIDLSWRMREREARQLAELMRTSRLSLLHAEPGIGRTELLTGALLPLLRRRASDAVGEEDRESRVVIPFSDRRMRRAGRSSTRIAERVVLFDAWGAQPLAALRMSVLSSLPADASTYARSARMAPMLGELSRRFDAHFLVILDSFERFWHPALTLAEAEAFVDQLSEAVNATDLRAHFLLSIDDLNDPRLDALRQRIHGFDASALQLLRWDGATAPSSSPSPSPSPESSVESSAPWSEGAALAPLGSTAPAAVRGDVDLKLPVLHDALLLPAELSIFSAASPQPLSPPLRPASSPTAVIGNRSPAVPGAVPAAAARSTDKPRRPKPPRAPFVKPEPIRTEGVYAFIESTLTQTSSDFAPWQGGDGAGSPSPPASNHAFEPRTPPVAHRSSAAPAGSAQGGRGTEVGAPGRTAPEPRLVEPPNPIDKALDSVFAWTRRLFRKT